MSNNRITNYITCYYKLVRTGKSCDVDKNSSYCLAVLDMKLMVYLQSVNYSEDGQGLCCFWRIPWDRQSCGRAAGAEGLSPCHHC